MARKTIFFVSVLVFSVFLAFVTFYLFNKPTEDKTFKNETPNETPETEELMAIIRKSPDYPEFLRIIKASDFDAELIEYYRFSSEIYEQKKVEWEQVKNEDMKELEQVFDSIKLNEDSYLVRLKSKTNSANGLLAVIDAKKKEPLVIVAEIAREMGTGM